MLTTRKLVAGCLPALLFACSAGGDDDTTPPTNSLHSQIQAGLHMFVPMDAGSVTLRGTHFVSPRQAQTTFLIYDGEVRFGLEPDGQPALTGLDLVFEDKDVTFLGLPVHLTGLRATLAPPVNAFGGWSPSLDEVTFKPTLGLGIDSALAMKDGRLFPLAAQELRGVSVDVQVFLDGGTAVAVFEANDQSVLWIWSDVARLVDVQAWLVAAAYDYSPEP